MLRVASLSLFSASLLLCLGCATTRANTDTTATPKACVILLHGLGRTSYSMNNIAEALQADGYTVWNEGYPSRSNTIETLASNTFPAALAFCRQHPTVKVHVVTHSLGGILLRHYLQANTIPNLDKIVMLSPPNHGSEIVDRFADNWLFRGLMGPAFLQLGTNGIVRTFNSIPGTIGIITGDKSSDPWFSSTIPGPDDGKVSVDSAKLSEMSDFLVVPVGHTSIMNSKMVIQQIRHFLEQGSFAKADDKTE